MTRPAETAFDDAGTNAYDALRSVVAQRIKEANLDPRTDEADIAEIVDDEIEEYQAQARLGLCPTPPLARPVDMRERLLDATLGYGPLTDLLADHAVEEIFIEGGDLYCVDGDGRLRSVDRASTEEELLHHVNKLLQTSGRELNERHPIVQARVFDGRIRLGVVGRPVADHLSVTLRKYTMRHETFDLLVDVGGISSGAAVLLEAAFGAGLGVLVCGKPGSGKTTLLNAALRAVPAGHRVLCCEEVRELSVPLNHGSYYQTRPATSDGGNDSEVTLRDIVKICLGMRPDLLVIGEVRGAEAFELLRAGNAGCGVLTTVHSNSARQGLTALVDTAIMAGQNVPAPHVRSTLAQVFDLVVFLDREDVQFRTVEGGGPIRRQVMEIAAIPSMQPTLEDFTIEPLFTRDEIGAPLLWTGSPVPADIERRLDLVLARRGTTVRDILDDHPAAADVRRSGRLAPVAMGQRP
jgi:pilus assembly protein CpaF